MKYIKAIITSKFQLEVPPNFDKRSITIHIETRVGRMLGGGVVAC